MGRDVGPKVLVYVSNLRLLGCFLLLYFGGVVLVVLVILVILVVVLVVTGGK